MISLLDALQSVRARPPKWVDVETLPLLRRQDAGVPLEQGLVHKAVADMKSLGPDSRGTAIDALSAVVLAEDLAKLIRTLWTAWHDAEQPTRDRTWLVYAMGQLGDDDLIAVLGRQVHVERDARRYRAAGMCLDALGRSQHPSAQRWLAHWVRKGPTLSMRRMAWMARNAKADSADPKAWVAPHSWGFSAQGMREYDHAGRMLRLVLSTNGDVEIWEGKRAFRSLPTARKKDDAGAVRRSRERFTALKAAIKNTRGTLQADLQEAMMLSRPLADWDAFLQSALSWRASRGLVYTADTPHTAPMHFFVSDEGDFLDVHGHEQSLPPDATVRIVHPLSLTADEQRAWQQILDAARAVPPFEQLHRRTQNKSTDPDPLATLLQTHPPMPAARLIRGLKAQGYLPDTGEHGGLVRQSITFVGPFQLTVHHDPYAANPYNRRHDQRLRIHSVEIHHGSQRVSSAALPDPLYSEVACALLQV